MPRRPAPSRGTISVALVVALAGLISVGLAGGAVPSAVSAAEGRVAATGWHPTAGPGTTGVPAGTTLHDHWGDLVITTPGTTIDAMDVHGFVIVKASGVTIKRSVVRGGTATGNIGLVTVDTPGSSAVVEDSELVPAHPSVWVDALKGSHYTALRVNAHGTVDLAKVYGDDVDIVDSWLHDARVYASDPNQGGGPSHSDGVQVLGGQHLRITGNTIQRAPNSALMVTQDYAATSDLVVRGNWVDDGWCSFNINNKPRAAMGPLVVQDNHFGGHDTRGNCAVIATRATTLQTGGDVWAATGLPVAIRNGG